MKLVAAAAVALALAGCGGGSSSPSSSTKGGYRDRVRSCLEHVGYKVSDAGNAMRVQRPTGDLIANIQTFPTTKAAGRFARGLVVAGSAGGRGVAVWLRDAGGDAKAVVTDCLTP